MSTSGDTPAPVDLVLLVRNQALLERTLAAFLASHPFGAAHLLTPQLLQPIAGFDEVVEALRGSMQRRHFPLWHRDDWALVGPARSSSTDREEGVRSFLSYPSPGQDEARIRVFAERYAWSLHPWYGTYQEGTSLFIAGDPELARTFAVCAERSAQRANVLSHYARVESAGSFGRFALFYDYGIEGRFAWRLARESGGFPLLVFELTERSPVWWQRAPWVQLVATQRSLLPVDLERRVYRITDARLFDAITWRGRGQAELPSLIVPDGSDPAALFDFLDALWRRNPPDDGTGLASLRDLGERVGWAQRYEFGGGSDEYHGVFCARDAAVATRFCEIVREYDEPGARLLHGRT
jgi:hypothetical protein